MEFEDHVRNQKWVVGETPNDHTARFPLVEQDPRKKGLKTLRGSRGDAMLAEASKLKGGLMKWVKEDETAKAWAVIHALIMSLVCIGFFLAMIFMWFFVYRKSFFWSVVILLACLAGSIGIAIYGSKKRDERFWIIIMGCTAAVVTFLGLFFGFFIYYRLLVYYQHYTEMRTYSNVGGSQSVSQFNDGSMFLFTQDSRLDVMRSVGYKSRWTGQVYCVSPVVDSTMTNADPINFWAVGEGCCLARGEFACDDAQDSKTMSALVVLEPEVVVRPFMRWAVAGSVFPRYERSIHLQEAAYATRAAANIKMLYWVKDPIAKQNSFYDKAKEITIWTTVLLWIFLLIVSYATCRYYRWLRPRADKRLQDVNNPATPLNPANKQNA